MKKGMCMRCKKFRILVSLIMLVCLSSLEVYAGAVDDEFGKSIVFSETSATSKTLFSYSKMVPGDIVQSKVAIKNETEHYFTLSLEIKNLHDFPNKKDLAEKLVFAAYDKNNGKIADCFNLASYPPYKFDFPDVFAPNAEICYIFEITLPGESTGNEYQNTSARLEFIFTATSAEPLLSTFESIRITEPVPERGSTGKNTETYRPSEKKETDHFDENSGEPPNMTEPAINEKIDIDEETVLGNVEENENGDFMTSAAMAVSENTAAEIKTENTKQIEQTTETKASFEQFINAVVDYVMTPLTGESLWNPVLVIFLTSAIFIIILKKKLKNNKI
jgi:hypothetical protein